MILIKKDLNKDEYEDLTQKSKTDNYIIKDYGYEYLINNNFIKSEKEYKGAKLAKKNDKYYLMCVTERVGNPTYYYEV